MPVYVFKLGKTIDAGELYNLLKAMMVNPAEMGCEVNGPEPKSSQPLLILISICFQRASASETGYQ